MPDVTISKPSAWSTEVTFGALSRTCDEYHGATWRELDDFYESGYQLMANAERYMPKLVNEPEARYRERLQCAAPIGYLAQVVDFFAAKVFTRELAATPKAKDAGGQDAPPFYTEFTDNVDRKNTTLSALLEEALATALLKRHTWIHVDLPATPDEERETFVSLADEEAAGAGRAYCYEVPPEQVLRWKEDDEGVLRWLVRHRVVDPDEGDPLANSGEVIEEFTVWRLAGEFAEWARYELRHKVEKKPEDKDPVRLVASSVTSFPRIPLIQLALPKFWVGNKIGPLCREHWARRASLVSSQNKSLLAVPWVSRGPEIPALGGGVSETQSDPHRANDPVGDFQRTGKPIEVGSQDALGYLEPSGSAYTVVDAQLKDLKDEIFRVVHQMAASAGNDGASLGRSGLSKQEDRNSESVVLRALGRAVRDLTETIFVLVAMARKDGIETWQAHGLDKYDTTDRAMLLQEALQINAVSIPSKTFRSKYRSAVALELLGPNTSPADEQLIRDEIEAGTSSEHDMAGMIPEPVDPLELAAAKAKAAPAPFGKSKPKPKG
jgi:hypothetical protein